MAGAVDGGGVSGIPAIAFDGSAPASAPIKAAPAKVKKGSFMTQICVGDSPRPAMIDHGFSVVLHILLHFTAS